MPLLGSDPNGCGSSLSKIAAGTIASTSSAEDVELSALQAIASKGKYSDAVAGYKKRFKSETNNNVKKYILARIADCYRKEETKIVASSGQTLLDYLNDEVGKKVSKNDELSAVILELSSQALIEQERYKDAINNYNTLVENFSQNKDVNAHAIFNLYYIYSQIYGDSVNSKKYFDALAKNYPDEELTYVSKLFSGKSVGKFSMAKLYEAERDNNVQSKDIPTETAISPNYPNPFNPTTTISYQLSSISNVSLKVFDMLGREVAILASGIKGAGYYTTTFDGAKLASGIYFARFVAQPQDDNQPFVQVKKLLMLK